MARNKKFGNWTFSYKVSTKTCRYGIKRKTLTFYRQKNKGGRHIRSGVVKLQEVDPNTPWGIHWETHCPKGLAQKFRRKGIGVWMYDKAIKEGFKSGYVTSSSAPSFEAERVWNSKKLHNKYIIKRRNGIYEVH